MLHIVDVALLSYLYEFGELYEDDDDKFAVITIIPDDHVSSWKEKDTGRCRGLGRGGLDQPLWK